MEDFETYTITGKPLKPHEYVVIKRVMTAGDDAWIKNHLMKAEGDKKHLHVQPTIGDVHLATLKRMIVRWSLTKTVLTPDGQRLQVPVEFSEQSIENLPAKISSHILDVINQLDDEEEADEDFSSAADGHSVGSS